MRLGIDTIVIINGKIKQILLLTVIFAVEYVKLYTIILHVYTRITAVMCES